MRRQVKSLPYFTFQKSSVFSGTLLSLEGTDSLILNIRSYTMLGVHITNTKDQEAIVIYISIRTY